MVKETRRRGVPPAMILGALVAVAGCDDGAGRFVQAEGLGDPERGKQAIRIHGCGSCHVIPGIPGANGTVGPRLTWMARQSYVAGVLPNLPENLVLWIQDPQAVDPRTAMPDMGVDEAEARDMAAYLYSIEGDGP